MDLVPIVNGVLAQANVAAEETAPAVERIISALSANWFSFLVLTVFFVLAMYFVRHIADRLKNSIADVFFNNWQLGLLGTTGVVLSLASGWTTWDGMRNFTGEPALSFMITFGIQGVMLIVAWLIGESFATGMNMRSHQQSTGPVGMAVGVLAAIVIVGIIGTSVWSGSSLLSETQIMVAAIAVAAIALIAVMQGDLVQPYLQSTRVILRNAVLWVMFIACMGTSVFFSFDSLFSTIFPAEERERAAQLRAQNQVAGIVADIGTSISNQQLTEARRLFDTEAWAAYEQQLDALADAAQGSQSDIEAYFVQQMEERRKAIAAQQERQATAQSQQAGLQIRKQQLTDELSRLQGERPGAATEVLQQQQVVAEVRRRLDAQRAVVLAEEKGVEGSLKAGRGPIWRAEKVKERKLQGEVQVALERLRAPKERLSRIDRRISSIKAELAQIDGNLAQLEGEAQTAQQRIAAAERSKAAEEALTDVDPARILPAFERSKVAFRQEPTEQRLTDLQVQCSQLLTAMLSTNATKDRVRSIDCDPKAASEAASVLFALQTGATAFAQTCAGGDKIETVGSTDGLFEFARRCLADSGLPSDQTDDLRRTINLAELNRDDKAHRFVVTWNAFNDGNRLAYLALGIAIAIDMLVFMSGLFGANAVRSPLQDVPGLKARSAKQLEATVENALIPGPTKLPNKFANARAALEAMQPITPVNGFTNEVILRSRDSGETVAIHEVLSAGSSIGAVAQDPMQPGRYLVRPELFEFLSMVAKREYEKDHSLAEEAEFRHALTAALSPHIGDHAHIVMGYIHPIPSEKGFTAQIDLQEVPAIQVPIMRRALNTGVNFGHIQRWGGAKRDPQTQVFHATAEFSRTINSIAVSNPATGKWLPDAKRALDLHRQAHELSSGDDPSQQRPPVAGPSEAGRLGAEQRDAIPQSRPRQIADYTKPGRRLGHNEEERGSIAGFPPRQAGGGADDQSSRSAQPAGNEFLDEIVTEFADEFGREPGDIHDIYALRNENARPSGIRLALEGVLKHYPKGREQVKKSDDYLEQAIRQFEDRISESEVRTEEQRIAIETFSDWLRKAVVMMHFIPSGVYHDVLHEMREDLIVNSPDRATNDTVDRQLEALDRHMIAIKNANLRSPFGWHDIETALRNFGQELASFNRAA